MFIAGWVKQKNDLAIDNGTKMWGKIIKSRILYVYLRLYAFVNGEMGTERNRVPDINMLAIITT